MITAAKGRALALGVLIILTIIGTLFVYRYKLLTTVSAGLMQEHEMSVVQALEWQYRNKSNATMPLIQHVDRSDSIAVGLPIKGQNQGYVWVLANPTTEPKLKIFPEHVDFRLTESQLEFIVVTTPLDASVRSFLEQHVAGK